MATTASARMRNRMMQYFRKDLSIDLVFVLDFFRVFFGTGFFVFFFVLDFGGTFIVVVLAGALRGQRPPYGG